MADFRIGLSFPPRFVRILSIGLSILSTMCTVFFQLVFHSHDWRRILSIGLSFPFYDLRGILSMGLTFPSTTYIVFLQLGFHFLNDLHGIL